MISGRESSSFKGLETSLVIELMLYLQDVSLASDVIFWFFFFLSFLLFLGSRLKFLVCCVWLDHRNVVLCGSVCCHPDGEGELDASHLSSFL